MAKIKGWNKSKKYDGTNPSKYTIYVSNRFPNNEYYVSIGLVGNTKKGYYSITDKKSQVSFQYKDYDTAKKEAIKYMRSHSSG